MRLLMRGTAAYCRPFNFICDMFCVALQADIVKECLVFVLDLVGIICNMWYQSNSTLRMCLLGPQKAAP